MKRSLFALCALSLCLSTAGVVSAAPKKTGKPSTPTPKQAVAMWAGTWNCVSGKAHYTTIFTPVLGGTAMQVATGGPNANSGIATFDSRQNKWFYSGVSAMGGYFAMTGLVSGSNISFSQVFGNATTATLAVRVLSSKKYADTYNAVAGGKKMTVAQTCSR